MHLPFVFLSSVVGLTIGYLSFYSIRALTPLSIMLTLTSLQLFISAYTFSEFEQISPIFNPISPTAFFDMLFFCHLTFMLFSIGEIFLYTKSLIYKNVITNTTNALSSVLLISLRPSILICVLVLAVNLPSVSNVSLYVDQRSEVREELGYIVSISLYILIPLIISQYSKIYLSYWHIALLSAFFILFSIIIGFRGLLLTLSLTIIFGELLKKDASFTNKIFAILIALAIIFSFIVAITIFRPEAQQSFGYALLNRVIFTPVAQFEIAQSLYFTQDYPGQWLIWQFRQKVFGFEDLTLGRAIFLLQYPGSSYGTGSAMIFGDFVAIAGDYFFVMVILTCIFFIWAGRVAMSRRNFTGGNIPIILIQIISVRWFLFGVSAIDVYLLIFFLSLVRVRQINAHN